MSIDTDSLHRDALTVLQPGFVGTTAPDGVRRQLALGLAAVEVLTGPPGHTVPSEA